MVKCLENQGYEIAASKRKVIIYINKFFNCVNLKNKNEGVQKRNDKLRPYVSAEDDRLKVCNLLLHNLTIFSGFYPSTFVYGRFPAKIQFLYYMLSLLSPRSAPMKGMELMSLDRWKIRFQHAF